MTPDEIKEFDEAFSDKALRGLLPQGYPTVFGAMCEWINNLLSARQERLLAVIEGMRQEGNDNPLSDLAELMKKGDMKNQITKQKCQRCGKEIKSLMDGECLIGFYSHSLKLKT